MPRIAPLGVTTGTSSPSINPPINQSTPKKKPVLSKKYGASFRIKPNKRATHASAILYGQEITERALYCFHPDSKIRRVFIDIANHPWFNNWNLGLIMVNCVFLIIESGRSQDKSNIHYDFDSFENSLHVIDAFFSAAFTVEMLVKIIAGGLYFAGPASYLRSWWNRLDCIVVIFALLNYIPSMSNFTYLRALKLLRPLKAASNIPGLRIMMNAMLVSTLTLGNVALFVSLLLFSFGLFGLQIYRGTFRWRCVPLDTGRADWDLAYGFEGCSRTSFGWDFVSTRSCPEGFFCVDIGTNPYADVMGYDNILQSLVMSLIVMSGEGWSDIMYMAEDAVSRASAVFFIVLACLAKYLAGELVVAVMSVKFEDAKIAEQLKMKEEHEQKKAVREAEKRIKEFKRMQKKEAKKRQLARESGQVVPKSELNDPLPAASSALSKRVGDLQTAQIMQLAAVIKAQNRQKAAEKAEASAQKKRERSGMTNFQTGHSQHPFGAGTFHTQGSGSNRQTFFSTSGGANLLVPGENTGRSIRRPPGAGSSSRRNSFLPSQQHGNHAPITPSMKNVVQHGSASTLATNPMLNQTNKSSMHNKSASQMSISKSFSSLSSSFTKHSTTMMNSTFHIAASKWSMHSEVRVPIPVAKASMGPFGQKWFQLRLLCHRWIFSANSFWVFSCFTVVNCALLGVDHWSMSQELSDALDWCNVAFTAVFAVEFLMRFIAIQWDYFYYGYFILDLISVVLAFFDSIFASSVPLLHALKAFRVFRMFTVFRHWTAMQKIMKQAHSSLQDLFYFSLVLALFVFIFAQLGVQIAAGKENFAEPQGPARDNWDSIGWAMIVVFQVSTPENWNSVLYHIVQGVGWGGGVFVIITLLIGHYIIESLFVVVMFSHFGTEEEPTAAELAAAAPVDPVQQMINRAQETSSLDEFSTMPGSRLGPMRDLSLHPGASSAAWVADSLIPNSARFSTRTPTNAGKRRSQMFGRDLASSGEDTGDASFRMRVDDESVIVPLPNQSNYQPTIAMMPNSFVHRSVQPSIPPTIMQSDFDSSSGSGSPSHRLRQITNGQSMNQSSPQSHHQRRISQLPVGLLGPGHFNGNGPNGLPSVPSATAPSILAHKGFIGRIARNIERSRFKKAQMDREKEIALIEKLKQSRSNSRRTSRTKTKVGATQAKDEDHSNQSTHRPSNNQSVHPTARQNHEQSVNGGYHNHRSSVSVMLDPAEHGTFKRRPSTSANQSIIQSNNQSIQRALANKRVSMSLMQHSINHSVNHMDEEEMKMSSPPAEHDEHKSPLGRSIIQSQHHSKRTSLNKLPSSLTLSQSSNHQLQSDHVIRSLNQIQSEQRSLSIELSNIQPNNLSNQPNNQSSQSTDMTVNALMDSNQNNQSDNQVDNRTMVQPIDLHAINHSVNQFADGGHARTRSTAYSSGSFPPSNNLSINQSTFQSFDTTAQSSDQLNTHSRDPTPTNQSDNQTLDQMMSPESSHERSVHRSVNRSGNHERDPSTGIPDTFVINEPSVNHTTDNHSVEHSTSPSVVATHVPHAQSVDQSGIPSSDQLLKRTGSSSPPHLFSSIPIEQRAQHLPPIHHPSHQSAEHHKHMSLLALPENPEDNSLNPSATHSINPSISLNVASVLSINQSFDQPNKQSISIPPIALSPLTRQSEQTEPLSAHPINLSINLSTQSANPPVAQSIDLKPPEYSNHVKRSRKRFVIAHHSAPSQPWYRQEQPDPFDYRSLFMFEPDNRFRLLLSRLVHSDAWSVGILLLIFFSCLLLALDYPTIDQSSTQYVFLHWADLATTSLYALELLIRFVVFGAVINQRACLRNGWNVMEFLIVIVSIASLIYPSVSGLKAMRALRPLRILSRLPGAKLVVSSLGRSMLNIGNVLVLAVLLMYCLAIVAVQLFKGRLQQCLSVPDSNPLAFDQVDCGANGGVWMNPTWTGNYDNVAQALLVLFELCTEENWSGTMVEAVDSTSPGHQPELNHNQWYGLFFVVAIVICSLFIKTLFTATILDGYSLNYAEITGAGGGTTFAQQVWLDFYKLAIDHPPPLSKPRPNTKIFHKYDLKLRRFFFDTAKSAWFEYFFLVVISVNVLALSLTFTGEPEWYESMLSIVNSICTWLFVCEIIVFWLGSGMRAYFSSRFNQFDFLIVLFTVYEFFDYQGLVAFHIGFNPSIFRVFRMIRIFKLFSKFPKLVQLGQTVWFSLPALYNVALLMLLEYFIFSVLGMALFGKVKHGHYMTDHVNYESFTSAMVTLFVEMTGENWNGIMRDCMVQVPFCEPELGNCGGTWTSPLFHVTFQVVSSMLVMDLIVAIILNQFENQLAKEKRSEEALMTDHDMKVFGEHWSHFSHGKYTMPVSKLPGFLRYLPPPLGFTKNSEQLFGVGMAHYLDDLKIPSDNQSVHYLDVIHQLGYRVYTRVNPEIVKMEQAEEETIADILDEELDENGEPILNESDEDRMLSDQESNNPSNAQSHNQSTNDLTQGNARTSQPTKPTISPSATLFLPYTTAGIRLVNEDLKLITRQAQRQFPSLAIQSKWDTLAGEVHRVIICQKLLRGVFDRKRLRERLVAPYLKQMQELQTLESEIAKHESQSATNTVDVVAPSSSPTPVNPNPAARSSPSTAAQQRHLAPLDTHSPAMESRRASMNQYTLTALTAIQAELTTPLHLRTSINQILNTTANQLGTPVGDSTTPRDGSLSARNLRVSALSPQTPGNRVSVIAELMAVRTLTHQHAQRSASNLHRFMTTSQMMSPIAASPDPSLGPGGVSPAGSTNMMPPAFKKALSLPFESTQEHEHEYEEGETPLDSDRAHQPILNKSQPANSSMQSVGEAGESDSDSISRVEKTEEKPEN